VLEHLTVELVRKRIDRGVHVGFHALGVDILAADMQVGRDLLPELVDRQHDVHVDDVIEVSRHPHQLVDHVITDRGRDVEMMTAQVQIHATVLRKSRTAAPAMRITSPCAC
jgi:hypothetical protein